MKMCIRDSALSFIKWMCSEPVASAATLLGSVSPCRKSYDNYEILNTFPWLNLDVYKRQIPP